jgi:biphenyl-2,3-diol 1,2-dioxygenase/3,4-dihydroxy-9,10-secoandrosta-1,3,5(10)-triene-9,17-dione 4,5-dioxygenase
MNTGRVTQLGYLGFEVSSLDAWRAFATNTLGLLPSAAEASGAFTLRMDSHPQRFFIEPGPADDVSVIGWQVADTATLSQLAAALAEFGIASTPGNAAELAKRKVSALIKYNDPSGIPSELFCGPELSAPPERSALLHSRFIADEQGLGHVVLSADDPARSIAFYRDVLGFRLSDEIRCEYFGHAVDIAFFHVNKRHHSLAIGQRQRKHIHHFMLEVAALDDVGLCFDRALSNRVPIMQTLGRHPNDRMFSFYAKTPSGFQFEFGYGGREVDDATWQPTTYDRISEWGHHPPIVFAPREVKRP